MSAMPGTINNQLNAVPTPAVKAAIDDATKQILWNKAVECAVADIEAANGNYSNGIQNKTQLIGQILIQAAIKQQVSYQDSNFNDWIDGILANV